MKCMHCRSEDTTEVRKNTNGKRYYSCKKCDRIFTTREVYWDWSDEDVNTSRIQESDKERTKDI